LPKHVWKPICMVGDPSTDEPDPNMIGSGPYRLKEYVEGSHILLVANSPGTTVTSPLPGATPVTSPQGYWRYNPIMELMHVKDPPELSGRYRIPPNTNFTTHWDFGNLFAEGSLDALVQANATIGGVEEPFIVNDAISLTPTNGSWFSVKFSASVSGSIKWDSGVHRTKDWYGPYNWYLGSTYYYDIHIWGKFGADGKITVDLKGVDTWTKTVTANVAFDLRFGVTIFIPFWKGYTLCSRVVIDPALIYTTIREDIAGSTLYDDIGYPSYPYKSELPSPDFKVDIHDIARASGAFGSYPGHSNWNPVVDQNSDYKVDIADLARVSSKFGWHA